MPTNVGGQLGTAFAWPRPGVEPPLFAAPSVSLSGPPSLAELEALASPSGYASDESDATIRPKPAPACKLKRPQPRRANGSMQLPQRKVAPPKPPREACMARPASFCSLDTLRAIFLRDWPEFAPFFAYDCPHFDIVGQSAMRVLFVLSNLSLGPRDDESVEHALGRLAQAKAQLSEWTYQRQRDYFREHKQALAHAVVYEAAKSTSLETATSLGQMSAERIEAMIVQTSDGAMAPEDLKANIEALLLRTLRNAQREGASLQQPFAPPPEALVRILSSFEQSTGFLGMQAQLVCIENRLRQAAIGSLRD